MGKVKCRAYGTLFLKVNIKTSATTSYFNPEYAIEICYEH